MPSGIYERTREHGAAISKALRGRQQPNGTRRAIIKHGENLRGKMTPEYRAWQSMKQRCSNPRHRGYKNYGGRGIAVARVWLDSFQTFLASIGRRPTTGHSIDRIDNDGNYEPGNVRWATRSQQRQNMRRK